VWSLVLGSPLATGAQPSETTDGHLHEDVSSLWVTTSSSRGCGSNLNGAEAMSSRTSVVSAEACRQMCERQGDCLAVDYYKTTETCNFYSQVCLAPLDAENGASSAHLMRETEWATISKSKACETNDEGIKPFHTVDNRLSLQDCQEECSRRAGCLAIDYYEVAGSCNLYRASCNSPKATQSGASSFKIISHMKARTLQEMKSPRLVPAAHWHWSHLHPSKACDGNAEGVTALQSPEEGGDSIEECKTHCENLADCVAIDYFSETGVCIPYARACMQPGNEANGASSWLLSSGPMHWEVLSSDHACESNSEGVHALLPGEGGHDIRGCQQKCELLKDCLAVDFYHRTKWCIFYAEACSTPHADADGASSYRIVRTALPALARGAQLASATGALHVLRRRVPEAFFDKEEEDVGSEVVFLLSLVAVISAICWLICMCTQAGAGVGKAA